MKPLANDGVVHLLFPPSGTPKHPDFDAIWQRFKQHGTTRFRIEDAVKQQVIDIINNPQHRLWNQDRASIGSWNDERVMTAHVAGTTHAAVEPSVAPEDVTGAEQRRDEIVKQFRHYQPLSRAVLPGAETESKR